MLGDVVGDRAEAGNLAVGAPGWEIVRLQGVSVIPQKPFLIANYQTLSVIIILVLAGATHGLAIRKYT